MTEFRKFADRFNKSANAAPSTQSDIDKLEKELTIQLPNDYKRFLLTIGNIWTPDILDLVVDKEKNLTSLMFNNSGLSREQQALDVVRHSRPKCNLTEWMRNLPLTNQNGEAENRKRVGNIKK